MKEMIIGFGLTTAVIVGAVLCYRKYKEVKEVFDEEEEEEENIEATLAVFSPTESKIIKYKENSENFIEEARKEFSGIAEPSPHTEGFQGLPNKAPIKLDDIADREYMDEFVNKADKAIQNPKAKKYPANRRRKKRSAK